MMNDGGTGTQVDDSGYQMAGISEYPCLHWMTDARHHQILEPISEIRYPHPVTNIVIQMTWTQEDADIKMDANDR